MFMLDLTFEGPAVSDVHADKDDFILPPALAGRVWKYLSAIRIAPSSEKLDTWTRTAQLIAGLTGPDFSLGEAAARMWAVADTDEILRTYDANILQAKLAEGFGEPIYPDEAAVIADDFEFETEIHRLAMLGLREYERERKDASERLNIRTQILDRLVVVKREKPDDGKQGRALSLSEPEPWPDPVNGTDLLDALSESIHRHLIMPDCAADTVALWTVHTYLLDCFGISPRLAITSPEKGCGKTTLIDVLSRLVIRPLPTANATAAAIFRVVEIGRPTLLIDEADTFLPEKEELRGILNSGHRRGGSVIRTVGENFEPRSFSTYSACAIALIGRLPPTLADRSVSIELRRRRSDEPISSFRFDRTEHLDHLARKAARLVADNADRIRSADPVLPGGMVNRAADNWRPLIAIADAAQGEWPDRARRAARSAVASVVDDQSAGVKLLTDIRTIFAARGVDRLPSAALVESLVTMEGRPWTEFGKSGKPISQNRLARLLDPYQIRPDSIRVGDKTPKGYQLADFEDAFSRYLRPEGI
jgi:putative DNA primase/helicase